MQKLKSNGIPDRHLKAWPLRWWPFFTPGGLTVTEKLLTSRPCGKNHVILTNIASLYLYNGNISGYKETKKEIQRSLGCNDVSDVLDETINDFYRYHFAWFEFYRSLVAHDWEKCDLQLN